MLYCGLAYCWFVFMITLYAGVCCGFLFTVKLPLLDIFNMCTFCLKFCFNCFDYVLCFDLLSCLMIVLLVFFWGVSWCYLLVVDSGLIAGGLLCLFALVAGLISLLVFLVCYVFDGIGLMLFVCLGRSYRVLCDSCVNCWVSC